MTTTISPHDRIQAISRRFVPDVTITQNKQSKTHRTQFDVRRGDRAYNISLSFDADYPDQNITVTVSRAHNGAPFLTPLLSAAYLDDSLLETVITQTINHDQEQA